MRRHLASMITLVFAICSLVQLSEAANLKKDIIGKWYEIRGVEQFEFLKDGTFIIVKGGDAIVGNYRFIDDTRLRLDISTPIFGSRAMVFEVSIDTKKGELTLKEPTGESRRFLTEKAYKIYKAQLEAQRKAEEDRMRKASEERWNKVHLQVKERIRQKFQVSGLTVLDKETKFMWTKDANIARKDIGQGLRKEDKAFEFVRELNQQKYAGYSDWRLPTKEELETLVNFAKEIATLSNFSISQGAKIWAILENAGFENVGGAWYWSASREKDVGHPDHVLVAFDDGKISNSYGARGNRYVWPVRAGQ